MQTIKHGSAHSYQAAGAYEVVPFDGAPVT